MLRILAVAAMLQVGCVGAHGARGRAVAIDATLAGGGALIAAATIRDGGFAPFLVGGLLVVPGLAGLLLTGISALGEHLRDDVEPLVAVRPWTAPGSRAPFLGTGSELVSRILAAARVPDCEGALASLDVLWARDLSTHAQVVRDPDVAACISGGGP
ncbi:MAG: hypothetical protein NT062_03925 [Proteobacteria bacterium]|nr:hypothetical protein [Pseudomonadota bacterium]